MHAKISASIVDTAVLYFPEVYLAILSVEVGLNYLGFHFNTAPQPSKHPSVSIIK